MKASKAQSVAPNMGARTRGGRREATRHENKSLPVSGAFEASRLQGVRPSTPSESYMAPRARQDTHFEDVRRRHEVRRNRGCFRESDKTTLHALTCWVSKCSTWTFDAISRPLYNKIGSFNRVAP